MAVLLTEDFSTGATWDTSKWNTTTTGTSTSIDILSGRGRMTLPNGSTRAVMATDKSTAQTDAEVVVKFEGMGSNRNSFHVIGVACSGIGTRPSIMSNGVWLKIPNNGTNVTVQHTHTGSTTQAGDLGFSVGTTAGNMWFRLKFSGGIIYVRAWWDGDAEPSTWNGTYNISGFASIPAGQMLLGTETTSSTTSGGSIYWDNITYQDAPSNVSVTVPVTPMVASGVMADPISGIDTNFNNGVNPFTTSFGSSQWSVSAASGDLVITKTATGSSLQLDVTGFEFVDGGEIAFHVKSKTGGTVYAHFGNYPFPTGSGGIGAGQWVRARINAGAIQSKVWSDSASEPTTWTNIGGTIANSTGGIRLDTTGSVGDTITIDRFVANEGQAVSLTAAASFTATAGTASGLMVSPSASAGAKVSAEAATGSGLAVGPVVTFEGNANVVVTALEGSGEMPDGSKFTVPVTINHEAFLASGESVDAVTVSDRNALVSADAMQTSAVLVSPLLEVDGEVINPELGNDLYYQMLLDTTDTGDYWYRINETSGTTVADARGDESKRANLFGTYSFNVYGPQSRKGMHFENGYFAPTVGTADSQGGIDSETSEMTFEVVLRTTDQNGVLAYGLDNKPFNAVFRNAIYLKDGKVSVECNRLDGGPTQFSLTGFKNVSDGQWHHIVVTAGAGNAKELDNGVRIYIDGKLDVRRRFEVMPDLWATPDSYMGMPDAWRMVTPLYPWQDNITADVMEVVFRKDADTTNDTAAELFYAVFGIIPVRVTPAVGYGQMPEPKAKGNQKRALVLYTKWTGQGLFNRIGDERNAPSGYSQTIPDEFDHLINVGRVYEPGENPWEDFAGFRVVPVSIMREDSNVLAGPYRDPVTDLPRLLDLQTDLNLEDYDVIIFRNWPDEGSDAEVFRSRGYSNEAIEDFLASVKQAVVDGMALEVTNINLASRLGLISGAQAIPMLVDKNAGVNNGERDLRGSMINPWDTDKNGSTYLDMHANNFHRVVALVEGLTDIADAEHITETWLTYNSGTNGEVNNRWGYKLSDDPLKIGDQIVDPIQFINRIKSYTQDGPVTLRPWDRYVWAVTPDGLNVGTPLYRFGGQMWQGNTLVDNPYAEFIGGAVVQPGDVWNGQQIAGRIFMNFAEAPQEAADYGVLSRQLVPDNSQISNPVDKESAEKREWDYSFYRVAFTSQGGFGTDQRLVLQEQADGTFKLTPTKSNNVVGINIIEKYPTQNVVVPSWAQRGLNWLAGAQSLAAGEVVVRPTAATATAALQSPVTVAERSVVIGVQAGLAQGRMESPDEVVEPDVTVNVFPMEGRAAMTGFGKTIEVAPFEGTGELVDNFELISAAGEQAVVYLLNLREVELYLVEAK